MPIMQLLHPKSNIANFNAPLFIANSWASGVLWVSIVLAFALLWARIRYKISLSQMEPASRCSVVCAALVILSSILLEFYETRYFIYVLPTIVLSFLIVISHLVRTLPRSSSATLAIALCVCVVLGIWRYEADTNKQGTVGVAITSANAIAVKDALATIHSRRAQSGRTGLPRIFATTVAQAIAMDDSCELVTPVMYVHPYGATPRRLLWERARIEYAIVCDGTGDWNEDSETIDSSARSHSRIIFERTGVLFDIA